MIRVILIIIGVSFFCACHVSTAPAEGEKKGQIVKLEKVGIFCKTWEGELIRGGFSDGGGVIGAPFQFTIEDMNLLPIALQCLQDQSEITLSYRTEGITKIIRSEHGTKFATGIKK